MLMQKPLNAGEVQEGLIAAEGYDDEIVDAMLNPHDDLNILVTLKASGGVERRSSAVWPHVLEARSGK